MEREHRDSWWIEVVRIVRIVIDWVDAIRKAQGP
jgi:hypothetical protein